MGYNTDFTGELRFTIELTASQICKLQEMLGEDCREHPEWGNTDLAYIDLELNKDMTGLRWNGSEKTYQLEEKVNVILMEMRKTWPLFGLQGELRAQGEDPDDRWILAIGGPGWAERREIKVIEVGEKIECPLCKGHFTMTKE